MRAQNADTESGYSGEVDWLVIVLNRAAIQDQILPTLAQRYFQGTDGLDYQVAVVTGNKPERIMYSSDPPFGTQEIADADGRMNIFGRRQDERSESPIRIFHAPSERKGPAASVGIAWFLLLSDQSDEQDWRLIVRHRRGGALGSFVADSRRRDLTLGFGVLFLLVISMAILISTSIRAQRLAKLQMDFVTAVSHELRSPITVISSAAENIAQGVVEGKEQLEQYGSVIGTQAKKLFDMVEQILFFASIREGQQRYNLRPLEVSSIPEAALSSTAELIHAAGFRVDQKDSIEPASSPGRLAGPVAVFAKLDYQRAKVRRRRMLDRC
jgi:signal transduction histidine kinase